MHKFKQIFLIFILFLYPLWAGAGELSWPNKVDVINPDAPVTGWLQSHEKAGGHTIERHVDKPDAYLKKRIKNNNINEASAFLSLSLAEQILAIGLWDNIEELARWMNDADAPDRLVIEARNPEPVGKGLRRGENKPSARFGARIVLQKTKDKKTAYILTAYPNARRYP